MTLKPSLEKKLQFLTERHEELSALLGDPDVISKQNQFRETCNTFANKISASK